MSKSSKGDPFLNTYYSSDGTYLFSSKNKVGNSATLTSIATVEPGVYSAKLYARASGGRAFADLYINNIKVATNLNTGNSGEGAITSSKGTDVYNLAYNLDENTITIAKPMQIEFKIVVTDVSQSGNLYWNALELTKIKDVTPISTEFEASIRLNDKTGIRFQALIFVAVAGASYDYLCSVDLNCHTCAEVVCKCSLGALYCNFCAVYLNLYTCGYSDRFSTYS